MEYDKDGKEVEIGHDVDWMSCPEDYEPPYNSQNSNDVSEAQDARRLLELSPVLFPSVEDPAARKGKFITLQKRELSEEDEDVHVKPFDDGLYFRFNDLIKPKHISFYCKTGHVEEHESCDFRLFMLDQDEFRLEDDPYGYD